MQIPLFSIQNPEGKTEYQMSLLDESSKRQAMEVSSAAAQEKVMNNPTSPFLGVVYRNQYIQVFGLFSCTGWTLLVGLENGPYNGDEV